ncbi:leukocyte immunoglobulin-like receptor subfamily A member 2 [Sturnira hondurensis]|uniref:leukocyte immunoglobulin-like receptor subfamily A member 2 n=1 Tax=Sturnira hondurensis TaxID=192404 RepID=UPI00187970A1|nr:leukocyte immunoglobulin-like receptor subfamily A member 2 [Sturnira hondurensis]
MWVCVLCQIPLCSPPARPSPASGSTMTIVSATFLCLGLCLGWETYLQTETLPKPTIWAEPSSVVAQGRPVSIWCQGAKEADSYYLHQEWVQQPWRNKFPQRPRDKVKFRIQLMTQDLAGRYHCRYQSQARWSVPSEPLDLVVTGMFDPPSLSALSGPLVTSGDSVTLRCGSWQEFAWFVLSNEGGNGHPKSPASQHQADGWSWALFTLGPMSPSHRWMYRCYGAFSGSPYVWSSSSNTLELLISGVSRKPSLSILPGPVVAPGDTVTLQCRSDAGYDRFILSKDGEQELPQQLVWKPQAGLSQTDFSLGPVSGSHGGRYRCYGGHSLSSEWSAPSDSLDILVAAQGLQWYWNVLIGVSVALVLLLFLLLLFLLLRHWHRSKGRTLDAAMKNPQPGEGLELDPQAAASAGPQDVTYAQLTHLGLRQEASAPPSSSSEQPPDEPSVYAALAVH